MKIIIVLIFVTITYLNANALNIVKYGSGVDDIKSIAQISRLSNITQKSLSLSSKANNIQDLLSIAVKENKVTYLQQFTFRAIFQNIDNGDKILLKCLKHTMCDVDNYSKIMTKSSLHRQIALRSPTMNVATSNHAVGAINENLMARYFQSTGWTKIEGEVGRNGIDGLFIKRNKNGQIIDILVAESKYNKSGLQHTKNGKQMSNEWVAKKILNLQKKYPNNPDYDTIKAFIDKGIYRSVLWNLKIKDDNLLVSLKQIHDKSGNIIKSDFVGGNKMKINFNSNKEININNPQTKFHKDIVKWYKEEIRQY